MCTELSAKRDFAVNIFSRSSKNPISDFSLLHTSLVPEQPNPGRMNVSIRRPFIFLSYPPLTQYKDRDKKTSRQNLDSPDTSPPFQGLYLHFCIFVFVFFTKVNQRWSHWTPLLHSKACICVFMYLLFVYLYFFIKLDKIWTHRTILLHSPKTRLGRYLDLGE